MTAGITSFVVRTPVSSTGNDDKCCLEMDPGAIMQYRLRSAGWRSVGIFLVKGSEYCRGVCMYFLEYGSFISKNVLEFRKFSARCPGNLLGFEF